MATAPPDCAMKNDGNYLMLSMDDYFYAFM